MTTSPTHSSEESDCYSSPKSFMEYLGISRTESAHSHFLAWLFTNRETCEQGIKRLIALLKSKSDDKHCFPIFLQDSWETGFQVESVKATLEKSIWVDYCDKESADVTANKYYGKIDLEIEVKHNKSKKPLLIVIENKVYSPEHPIGAVGKRDNSHAPYQTQVYATYYLKEHHDKDCLFGYLTLNEEGEPQDSIFIHFTYQDVLDQILFPLMPSVNDAEVIFRIKDYMACLQIPDSRDGVMAVGPLTKEGTKKPKEKDRTHYSINGKGNYNKNQLIRELVRLYIKRGNDKVTFEDLQKAFPSTMKGEGRNEPVVLQNEKNRYYPLSDVRLNDGTEVYVHGTGWDTNELMERVISYVKAIEVLKDLDIKPIERLLTNQ